jgi:hypothetical protein
MRTLNRPMFRYGGPIKEGVMDGIREPKRNGGPMVKQAALVGNSAYPQTDGREHHKFNIFGLGSKAGNVAKVGTGGQTSGIITQGVRNFYNKIKNKLGTTTTQPAPYSPVTFVNKKPKFTQSGFGGATNSSTGGLRVGAGGTGIPKGLGTNTTFEPGSALKYLAGSPEGKIAKYLWNGKGWVPATVKTIVKSPTAAIALTWTGVNWILPNGEPAPNQPDAPTETFKNKKGSGTGTGESRSNMTAKEIRDEQIKNYREIMDIKGMNKDAAYNSLIAASQAISEEGDFKGSIKDGSLINKLIQSTSKQFDKPKATKDAIDSLILKSQIQKDMNKDKDALDREYKQTAIDINKQKLDSSFQDNKLLAANAKLSGQAAFDAAAGKSSENFRGNIVPNSEWVEIKADIKKKGGGMDDITIIANWTNQKIKGKQVPNGDYTVGDALVTIEEGQVTNITR